MYLFKFELPVEAGVVLILCVRPTSDSEAEETKGDTSRAMAPPPLPLAKKVRYCFEFVPSSYDRLLVSFPRSSCWASMVDVKTQQSP
jgi:hypothetical protein